MQQVTVYINRKRDKAFEGYQQGDQLVPAVVFEVNMAERTEAQLLEEIFSELNVDNPQGIGTLTLEMIATYHRAYPSISVGDVIELSLAGESDRWAIARAGFEKLEAIEQVPQPVSKQQDLNVMIMIASLNHEAHIQTRAFAEAISGMPEPEARALLGALEDLDLRIQQAKATALYEERFKN